MVAEAKKECIKYIEKYPGNAIELKHSFDFFLNKGDQEELQALLYILKNLDEAHHAAGPSLDEYKCLFDYIKNRRDSDSIVYNRTIDSLQKTYSFYHKNQFVYRPDLDDIEASVLIEHIESSFKKWRSDATMSLSKQEFYEFILPIKLSDEEITPWMKDIQVSLSFVSESKDLMSSRMKLCRTVNAILKKNFSLNARFYCPWTPSYENLDKIQTGTCAHATQYACYYMRAMGLPVSMDFTPLWGNKNSGHEWNALILKGGKTLPFVGSESDPGKSKIIFTRYNWIHREIAKVFRRSFQQQKVYIEKQDGLPDYLFSSHLKDVTTAYVPVTDVKIYPQVKTREQSYLCVFNSSGWKPIFYGIRGFTGSIIYEKMGRGIVYLPVIYKDNMQIPIDPPFILMGDGKIKPLIPQKSTMEKVVIRRKYPESKGNRITKGKGYELLYWDKKWVSLGIRMATADSIVYTNCPKGALLWIKGTDDSDQNRIFQWQNEKQVWW